MSEKSMHPRIGNLTFLICLLFGVGQNERNLTGIHSIFTLFFTQIRNHSSWNALFNGLGINIIWDHLGFMPSYNLEMAMSRVLCKFLSHLYCFRDREGNNRWEKNHELNGFKPQRILFSWGFQDLCMQSINFLCIIFLKPGIHDSAYAEVIWCRRFQELRTPPMSIMSITNLTLRMKRPVHTVYSPGYEFSRMKEAIYISLGGDISFTLVNHHCKAIPLMYIPLDIHRRRLQELRMPSIFVSCIAFLKPGGAYAEDAVSRIKDAVLKSVVNHHCKAVSRIKDTVHLCLIECLLKSRSPWYMHLCRIIYEYCLIKKYTHPQLKTYAPCCYVEEVFMVYTALYKQQLRLMKDAVLEYLINHHLKAVFLNIYAPCHSEEEVSGIQDAIHNCFIYHPLKSRYSWYMHLLFQELRTPCLNTTSFIILNPFIYHSCPLLFGGGGFKNYGRHPYMFYFLTLLKPAIDMIQWSSKHHLFTVLYLPTDMFPAQSFLLPYIPLSRDQTDDDVLNIRRTDALKISSKKRLLASIYHVLGWNQTHSQQNLNCLREILLGHIYGFRKCCVFCCILYIFNSCAEIITINLLPWLVKLFFIGLLGKYLAHCRKILVIYFYFHNFHTAEVGSRCKDMLVWQLIMFCFIQVGYIHCGITFGFTNIYLIIHRISMHIQGCACIQLFLLLISVFMCLGRKSHMIHIINCRSGGNCCELGHTAPGISPIFSSHQINHSLFSHQLCYCRNVLKEFYKYNCWKTSKTLAESLLPLLSTNYHLLYFSNKLNQLLFLFCFIKAQLQQLVGLVLKLADAYRVMNSNNHG
ncbi:putative signal peptide protein [Puccinia sorghi]|uniref:Putative signal peptide protein n=1 Tax=Puccinia sorghi TaxID=27349 RepID=A0A0L6VIS6_9BASI|nr:putative signal peptide protein [Puccinia sorghi]